MNLQERISITNGLLGLKSKVRSTQIRIMEFHLNITVTFGGMCARDNGVDILLNKQLFKHLEKQGEKKSADSYCQENCKGFQETGKCFADEECKAKRDRAEICLE